MSFWAVESKVYPNTHFVFRETGMEVRVEIVEGNIKSDNRLNKEELKYFKKNVRKNETLNIGAQCGDTSNLEDH
ncbi:MAG: hypothetical protein AAF348_18735 [Bacteroidota bacterium]